MLNTKRTFLLVDETNNGIVGGINDHIIVNYLRRGILDLLIIGTNLYYDPLNPNTAAIDLKTIKFMPLVEAMNTPVFQEKKRLINLREPAFQKWKDVIITQLATQEVDFYTPMDAAFEQEFSNSSIKNPSEALKDYSVASGMSLTEIYEFYKLQIEENHRHRLITHAFAMKYANKINSCTIQVEMDKIVKFLTLDFSKNIQI